MTQIVPVKPFCDLGEKKYFLAFSFQKRIFHRTLTTGRFTTVDLTPIYADANAKLSYILKY